MNDLTCKECGNVIWDDEYDGGELICWRCVEEKEEDIRIEHQEFLHRQAIIDDEAVERAQERYIERCEMQEAARFDDFV